MATSKSHPLLIARPCTVLLLVSMVLPGAESLQLSAEWHMWKAEHRKSYVTDREEVYRHVVWQSNSKFISAHNQFNLTFGYTLAMNEMGDLVRDYMPHRNQAMPTSLTYGNFYTVAIGQ